MLLNQPLLLDLFRRRYRCLGAGGPAPEAETRLRQPCGPSRPAVGMQPGEAGASPGNDRRANLVRWRRAPPTRRRVAVFRRVQA
eukprot:363729-Chlamydomonas_euryale.AAC.3